MLAYSEVLNGADEHSTKPADLGIRMKNLKKFMLCVLKLALESKSEIMLDYPIDKLAAATAERCFEFAGIADKSKGICSLEHIMRFIETANPTAILAPTAKHP